MPAICRRVILGDSMRLSSRVLPIGVTLDLDVDDRLPFAIRRERLLLILAGIFLAVNQSALILARQWSWLRLWPVGVWMACALAGHMVLNRRLPARDPLLFPLAMFLSGWGLTLVARLVPPYVNRQALWLVIGLGAMLAVTLLPDDLRWLRRYRYTWLIGGLALLVITILVGQNPAHTGPRLWLWLGFGRVYYQPSELLKILLVVFLASYFADHQPYLREDTVRLGPWRVPSPAFLAPVLLMWGVCMVVLVWQKDLGAATLFFVVFMVMLYLASGQTLLLAGGALLLIAAGAVAYTLFSVVALRVDIWWNPWPNADAQAYQVVQSLTGRGLGRRVRAGHRARAADDHPGRPFRFCLRGHCGRMGLAGVLTVLFALAALVVRGMRIAVLSRGPFRTLLAAGLSVLLAVQSLLIAGGVLKLVPLTGVTLPFVSYGGSSLLTNCVIVGLLLMLSGEEGVAR